MKPPAFIAVMWLAVSVSPPTSKPLGDSVLFIHQGTERPTLAPRGRCAGTHSLVGTDSEKFGN